MQFLLEIMTVNIAERSDAAEDSVDNPTGVFVTGYIFKKNNRQ